MSGARAALDAIGAEDGAWTVEVEDRLALREGVAVDPQARARIIAVLLRSGRAVVPRPDASWPPVKRIRARRVGGSWLIVLRFGRPAPVAVVLASVARQAVWRDAGNDGVWIAPDPLAPNWTGSGPGAGWPGEDDHVPPDAERSQMHRRVVTDAPASGHESTGGVARGGFETLAALAPQPAGVDPVLARPILSLTSPAIEPIDERVINPTGFRPKADGGVVQLPAGTALSEGLVLDLRPSSGARVAVPTAYDAGAARLVAGLAMSGTPLLLDPLPAWLGDVLGPELAALLASPPDLADPLAREEHSLEGRRAALDGFSLSSWRRGVAAEAGLVRSAPSVSVLLATRRPDMLEFAIRQVARQAWPDLELVLAPHGFVPDEAAVRRLLGDHTLVLAPQPETTAFGDVLHEASLRASGSLLLKMDDDDWYAPDVVADLVRAQGYSGAEVVGMPAEFHYLTEQRVTVRRGHTTEHAARFVAGGTLMIERGLLREVGGFRSVRKYVDAQLLAAVERAGGSVYRTHGLGYVLRRNPSGHTWQVDADYLLDPSRVWSIEDGFRPSRLLAVDEADLPA